MSFLQVDNLVTRYGAITALQGVSLRVEEGEIVTLIGANGAGKTTLLRTLSGILRPATGAITFRGENITPWQTDRIVRAGIVQSPEGRLVFRGMSVRENLQLGAYTRRDRDEIAKDMGHVFELFPRLKERLNQSAGTLSGGEQQMLAIGRALMSRPKLLMLDEPSLGLAPLLVREIFRIVEEINREGVTVLLVEQNARQALAIAHRGYVLQTGQVVMEDTAAALAQNEVVRKAYLGG
ncbi:MAG: ABC transporter ATP-binding protein [Armatimonadetes bacterium]|nr:ABC transporter ATP-binding protein [Armatimonadota bacterium]